MKKRKLFIPIVCAAALSISACGGGGGGDNPNEKNTELTGQFIDSAVTGLFFETDPSNVSGFTDANGEFQYTAGDTVSFYIGDIFVGSATGSSVITPVSLVSGATDEDNPVVANIARLLQTLDDNDNPSDGIVIPIAVFDAAMDKTIDFADTENFDTDATNLLNEIFTTVGTAPPTLVTAVDAKSHLAGSIISSYSGTYSGTWLQTAGPDSDNGVWAFTIDGTGDVTGCGQSNINSAEFFTLSGSLTTSGSIDVTTGTTNTGATFSATIDANGNLAGNWENTGHGISGTFQGGGTASPSIACSPNVPPVDDGDFGSLAISGDVGFESPYIPVVSEALLSFDLSGNILWSITPDFTSTRVGSFISVSLVPSTGEITAVYAGNSTNPFEAYYYSLNCSDGDCSGISIDMTERTVSFNEFMLPVDTNARDNAATNPITISGTVSYPPS